MAHRHSERMQKRFYGEMANLLRSYFAALDPRMWMTIARSVRCSEGWRPPMSIIAILGTVAFGSGIVRASAVATSILYLWAASWAVVFSIASFLALVDSMRNVIRYRLRGYKRSRYWFEIARSLFILGVMFAIPTSIIGMAGLLSATVIGDVLLLAILSLLSASGIAAVLGYAVQAVTRRKVLGRAKQCVDFFALPSIAGFVVCLCVFVFAPRLNDPRSYGVALTVLVLTCLSAALSIKLKAR